MQSGEYLCCFVGLFRVKLCSSISRSKPPSKLNCNRSRCFVSCCFQMKLWSHMVFITAFYFRSRQAFGENFNFCLENLRRFWRFVVYKTDHYTKTSNTFLNVPVELARISNGLEGQVGNSPIYLFKLQIEGIFIKFPQTSIEFNNLSWAHDGRYFLADFFRWRWTREGKSCEDGMLRECDR